MQGTVCGDVTVLSFLLFRAEHEIEAVALVVIAGRRLVVGVHDQITAARLVVPVDEPVLDARHQLRTDVLMQILLIHAKPADQDGWVNQVALRRRDILADLLLSRIRQVVREDAGI